MFDRLHSRLHWRGPGHDLTIDGRASRLYDLVFARWPLRALYRHVAAEAAAVLPAGATVLDAGTGPGRLLVELARRRPDVRLTGIDLSTDMVAIAERNVRRAGHVAQIEVRAADVAALPFPDAAFDLVVSTLSMHHWGAVAPAMTELARVLRPGGGLWIYDLRTISDDTVAPAADEAFDGQPAHRTLPRTGRLPGRFYARWTVTKPATARA